MLCRLLEGSIHPKFATQLEMKMAVPVDSPWREKRMEHWSSNTVSEGEREDCSARGLTHIAEAESATCWDSCLLESRLGKKTTPK